MSATPSDDVWADLVRDAAALRVVIGQGLERRQNVEAAEAPPWVPQRLSQAAAGEPGYVADRFGGMDYGAQAETILSAEPGIGKSMVAAAYVAEARRAGEPVLILDFERTAGMWHERLLDMGLSDDQLAGVLYHRPRVQATPEQIRALVQLVQPSLIVVDGYDAALAAFGYETKNEDVRAFHGAVIEPLRSTGAHALITDHVPKNREARGRFSIGGQSKLGLADVHLGLSAIVPLRRGSVGKLKVKVLKDNFGHLPRAATFELASDEDTGALSWTVRVEGDGGSDDDAGEHFRPTRLMERVSRQLEIAGQRQSRNQIEQDVKGKGEYVRQAMDALVREGYADEELGPNRSRMLAVLRPFREDHDA